MRSLKPFLKIQDYGPVGWLEATRCPFLEKGKCSIYEDRPLMCRVFPLVLYQIAQETTFDLGLCPRRDPGYSTDSGASNDETVLAQFHTTKAEFFGLLALHYIKETRVDALFASLPRQVLDRIERHRTELGIDELKRAVRKVRPVLPPNWLQYFQQAALQAYRVYVTSPVARTGVRTRDLVMVCYALIKWQAKSQGVVIDS